MSRKNIWVRDVEKMLQERAMSSTEISFALKDRFGYRYNPHARKITLVLRGSKDKFIEMDKVSVSSPLSVRRESHNVSLWGLREVRYQSNYPYTSLWEVIDCLRPNELKI